jgi:hypothetical protein
VHAIPAKESPAPVCRRLVVLFSRTSTSWSERTSDGVSRADTERHRNPISGSASARRVIAARSRSGRGPATVKARGASARLASTLVAIPVRSEISSAPWWMRSTCSGVSTSALYRCGSARLAGASAVISRLPAGAGSAS